MEHNLNFVLLCANFSVISNKTECRTNINMYQMISKWEVFAHELVISPTAQNVLPQISYNHTRNNSQAEINFWQVTENKSGLLV